MIGSMPRASTFHLLAVVVAVALAWMYVLLGPTGMGSGLALFIVPWTLMMTAMMLPSAAPLVLLYARGASTGDVASLAAGYLVIWAIAGLPAYFAHMLVPATFGPAALGIAGIYQLTPLKRACLSGCRSPADFLVQRWGRGALRIGIEHGLWCLGCCWALMMVLVLVGGMGIGWVIALTAVVAIEKMSRHGVLFARVTGVALIVLAIYLRVSGWHGMSMEMS